ncbi:uncharacterized protein LOC124370520 [Homalodisca vitripennis]|uniref:uncharacterized protein LOC124370520 n=1 Tax=Homalodisca vitripennis TaxID=197043 RepID=UPI001EEA2628|nr:uncharacterized protein LOC124370520 [Homalodisca vitripennis]
MAGVYMQRQLNLLEPWLRKWRIKVNADKCESHQLHEKSEASGRPTSVPQRVCTLARKGFASIGPLLYSKKLPVKTKVLLYTAPGATGDYLRGSCVVPPHLPEYLSSESHRVALVHQEHRGQSIVSNISTIRTFVDGLTSSLEEAAESSPWEHIRQLQAQEVPRLRPPMDD